MSISLLVITVVFIETFRIHSYNSGGSVIATGFVRESLKQSQFNAVVTLMIKIGPGGI